MTRTTRVGALIAVVLLLAPALTACVGQAAPAEAPGSPPSSAAPTSSPTPEPDPLDTVAVLVVRPEALELADAAGTVVLTLSYDAPIDEFTGTLAAVLGAEPTTSDWPGGMETHPRRDYEWQGLTVTDDLPGTDDPVEMNVSIVASDAVVGDDVEVRTAGGFRPGDDMAAFAESTGEPFTPGSMTGLPAEYGPELDVQSEWSSYPNANAVMVFNYEQRDPAAGDPGWVSAPWNFGVGHV